MSFGRMLGVGASLLAITLVARSPQASAQTAPSAVSPQDTLLQMVAEHNGYLVSGKDLSARYARALSARLNCADATTCAPAHQQEDIARRALLARGRAVLDSAETDSSDPTYAQAEVAVLPGSDGSRAVITRLPVSTLPADVLSAHTSNNGSGALQSIQAAGIRTRMHPDAVGRRSPRGQSITWLNCTDQPGNVWCWQHVYLDYGDTYGTLYFDFIDQFKNTCSTNAGVNQVWGQHWNVYGSSNDSWSGIGYTNWANSDHSTEAPSANGVATYSLGGGSSFSQGYKINVTINYMGVVQYGGNTY